MMDDIIKIIYEKSKETAPVTIQFGRTINGIVHHDEILIKSAAPAIISRLIEAGCSVGICEEGAYVYNL